MKKTISILFILNIFIALSFADMRGIGVISKNEKNDAPVAVKDYTISQGHAAGILSICYSADGKYIITSSGDYCVKLWDVSSMRLIRTFYGHTARVFSANFSHSGNSIVTCSFDKTIRIWDFATGVCLKIINCNDKEIHAAYYSNDDKYIISCEYKNCIKVWDAKTGSLFITITDKSFTDLNFISLSPINNYVISAATPVIKIWDFTTGICVKTLSVPDDATNAIFSPDGKYIAVSFFLKNKIRIYNSQSGILIKTISLKNNKPWILSYSNDGNYLGVTYGSSGVVDILNMKTGKIHDSKEFINNMVTAINFSPNCNTFVIGSTEVKFFDMQNHLIKNEKLNFNNGIMDGVWSKTGNIISYVNRISNKKHSVKFFDFSSGRFYETKIRDNPIYKLYFSPNEKYVAAPGFDNICFIYDLNTGNEVGRIEHDYFALCASWSPDNRYIATGSQDCSIKISSTDNWTCINKLTGHNGNVMDVSFSPDGTQLASCSIDKTIKIWNPYTGECKKTLYGHSDKVRGLCYIQNGKFLVTGSEDKTVKIWNIDSEICEKTIDVFTDKIIAIEQSHDKKYIATISNSEIIIWNNDVSKLLLKIKKDNPVAEFENVAFNPQNNLLAVFQDDGLIKVWNIETSKLQYTFIPFGESEYITYTPEGFFTGTEWATKNLVYLVDGLDIIELDQMYDKLYRPDLVAAKIQGQDISAYAQGISLFDIAASGAAPVVNILNKNSTSQSRDIMLDFSVTDKGGGIGSVNISLNGRVIRVSDGSKNSVAQYSWPLSLSRGENTITVSAYNDAEKIESVKSVYKVSWQGREEKPELYVLAVGVNQYRDKSLQLNYAVPDAQAVQKKFSVQNTKLYNAVHIECLFDSEVTKKNISEKFSELSSKIKTDDVFILYIAGHGTVHKDGDYYFIPADFRYKSEDEISLSGVSKTDLTKNLSLINASKSLVILDTCNSGAFISDKGQRGMSEKTAIDRLSRATGHATIVAAGDSQSAMEGYNGHGLFTYVLVEGLNGKADTNKDGFITLTELSNYIDNEVPNLSYEKWGYEQIPQRDLGKQDFPIYAE